MKISIAFVSCFILVLVFSYRTIVGNQNETGYCAEYAKVLTEEELLDAFFLQDLTRTMDVLSKVAKPPNVTYDMMSSLGSKYRELVDDCCFVYAGSRIYPKSNISSHAKGPNRKEIRSGYAFASISLKPAGYRMNQLGEKQLVVGRFGEEDPDLRTSFWINSCGNSVVIPFEARLG